MTVISAQRAEPERGRSVIGSLLRFGVTGVCSAAVDAGVLSLLHSGFGVRLLWSTLAAYFAGLVVNYSLNRNWSFQATVAHRRSLVRYSAMVAFNVTSTVAVVVGLTHLGLFYLLSKLVAVALNAGVNFMASRYWVFAREPAIAAASGSRRRGAPTRR